MKLKILFMASEASPYIQSGGLGNVAGSLPPCIRQQGHDVRLVIPEYGQIPVKYIQKADHLVHFRTMVAWRNEYVGINYLSDEELPVYFIDNKDFFHRPTLYEDVDRDVKFTYFCRAALDMLPHVDFKPDIIHFNDWQTGPVALLLDEDYRDNPFYKDIRTLYTIHNLRYQGRFGHHTIEDVLGINRRKYWDSGIIRHDDLVNYMKAGIMKSDCINTVSRSYAEEIKTQDFGEGLDYALRMRGDDLYGILNGIDCNEYNPETDDKIYYNYDRKNLSGKYKNKTKLQEEMDLPQLNDVPLIGVVSRLVEGKGFGLLGNIVDELFQENIQLVVLGTGQPDYEELFRFIAARYPYRVSFHRNYDPVLAQKIYAGIDIFLMPSMFEPCGLSQMIAYRYGSVPLVRKVGGLKDTVIPYNEVSGEGTGFVFEDFSSDALLSTAHLALKIYSQQNKWKALVNKIMNLDYSWKRSAGEYIDLYQKICKNI